MDMNKILFLDLEDTIITPVTTGWHNIDLINLEKIKSFILENKITTLNIFSFAIWNESEKEKFSDKCLPWIESELGHKVSFIPTVDSHIINACCLQKGLNRSTVDFSDLGAFWSKDIAFMLCIKEWFKDKTDNHCFLLDDVVENVDMFFSKNNLKISILNVDKL